jgi:hypothetical protein
MLFRQDHCEFKSNDQVLVVATDGTEQVVQLVTEFATKKNLEVIETNCGHGLPMKEMLNKR